MANSPDDVPTTATTIYSLNDHVLREVFKHLNTAELCTVADVNTDFKRNARAEFSHRNKAKCFTYSFERIGNWKKYAVQLQRLFSILRNFGTVFRSMEIRLHRPLRDPSRNLMKSIGRFCPALMKLFLRDFRFTADSIPKMRPWLIRLKVLDMENCRWDSPAAAYGMLSFCSRLQTLRIKFLQDLKEVDLDLQNGKAFAMPDLKSLAFTWCPQLTNKSIENFIRMVPGLRTINLTFCDTISSEIVPAIVQHCPRMKRIEFWLNKYERNFIENLSQLKHLIALEALTIDCNGYPIASVIGQLATAGIPLKHLELRKFITNRELVTGIEGLKQLQTLKLVFGRALAGSEILAIVKNLNQLAHLTLRGSGTFSTDLLMDILQCVPKLCELDCVDTPPIKINAQVYLDILNYVSTREDQLGLCMSLAFNSCIAAVPVEWLLANQNLLKLCID